MLRRGSTCGLKIDVDGNQLTSEAAHFRVASHFAQLTPGMARIRAAKDICDRTLDSFTVSWDEKYFPSSTAYSSTSAFQLVYGMDRLRCLRNLPAHKMQSGAATLLRQSGNILDIAQAICKRSNRVLGFVNQYRMHLLMKGLCRATISCKPGLVVGAVRVACNGLCTAARFHTVDEHPGCNLGCTEKPDCLRHYNCCPILFDHLKSLWPGTDECISPTAILNDLLFKIAVRSDRLCILESGFLDAFVSAFNLRRTNRGSDLNC